MIARAASTFGHRALAILAGAVLLAFAPPAAGQPAGARAVAARPAAARPAVAKAAVRVPTKAAAPKPVAAKPVEAEPPEAETPKVGPADFAYVDPELAKRAGKAGRNPLYRRMVAALDDYRERWGELPAVRIAPGPELKPGAKGPRLAALRQRLGLDPEGSYDVELADSVSTFQFVHGLTPSGRADAATIAALNAGPERYLHAIEANIERARRLPARLGDRYILVDVAAGRMTLVERGRETAEMKVVTGKPSQPTPVMAAMATHLIFNPFWNVPEDLVRTSIAPKVLAQGMAYVEQQGLQVLSDYTAEAVELDPAKVDWRGVARGRVEVRVRQRPGPHNMMGQVKLMLPNPLGVYLHDTPLKGDFERTTRLASSGCVRLEDAVALARALVGDEKVDAALDGSGEERRVDLKRPVPVYIVYLTVETTPEGPVFRPDVYGRDRAWAVQVARAEAQAAREVAAAAAAGTP